MTTRHNSSYQHMSVSDRLPRFSVPSFPGRCTLLHTRIRDTSSLRSAAVRTYLAVMLSNSSALEGQLIL